MSHTRCRWMAATLGLLALLVVLDLRRPPPDQVLTRASLGALHAYQATLSRAYARMGVQCRFTLSCSHYAEECLRRFGVVQGGALAVKRVLRCGPWTPMGTVDPPPG
jgi:uncharacterized protein